MSKKPKSINGLMKYLRTKKEMTINGATHKLKLSNIGYYHGYKGYRYIGKPFNQIAYNDFDELTAIYNFDATIKGILYPHVMFIETALKNRVLNVLINKTKSESFILMYNQLLIDYQSYSTKGKKYSNLKNRLKAEEKYKKT